MFVYHATIREFLPSIARKGLLANYHKNIEEEVIFVEPSYEEAAIYLEPGRGVMLRIEVNGIGDTADGEYVLYDIPRIEPEKIDVRYKGEWVPLCEFRNRIKELSKETNSEWSELANL